MLRIWCGGWILSQYFSKINEINQLTHCLACTIHSNASVQRNNYQTENFSFILFDKYLMLEKIISLQIQSFLLFCFQSTNSLSVWRLVAVGSIKEEPTWHDLEDRVSHGPNSRLTHTPRTRPCSTTPTTAEICTLIVTITPGATPWTLTNDGSIVISRHVVWNWAAIMIIIIRFVSTIWLLFVSLLFHALILYFYNKFWWC